LVSVCAGLPLALGIVAAQAARYPRHPLRTLAAEFTAVEFDGGEVGQRLARLIDASLRWLSPEAVRLFALFGLAPTNGLDVQAVASLAGEPVTRVLSPLRELDDAHLVATDPRGRYRMHDLTFEYAAVRSGRSLAAADRDVASRRLTDHYVLTGYAASRALERPFDPP